MIMSKSIRTIVGPNGDIQLETGGFADGQCLIEEQRLRQELEKFGLKVTPIRLTRKTGETAAQTANRSCVPIR
jgi:hypothetical protein